MIGTVRSSSDEAATKNAGAHEVLVSDKELPSRVRALAPHGIDHIVEVAFGANIEADVELLKLDVRSRPPPLNGQSLQTVHQWQPNPCRRILHAPRQTSPFLLLLQLVILVPYRLLL